jgi:SEC-C motif-containing protein
VINGTTPAATPEALMRSRYSAYAMQAMEHLKESLHPEHRADYDDDGAKQWAESSEWMGLEIRSTSGGGPDDEEGTVEFLARYRRKGGEKLAHHEEARFTRHKGRWYYVDGRMVTAGTVRNDGPKVGRNDPCTCGSGKKYKKCCGAN